MNTLRSTRSMRSIDTIHATRTPTSLYNHHATTPERHLDDSLHSDDSRESHELSLVMEGNRNSVVDHMLLSLDSMPTSTLSFPNPGANLYSKYNINDEPPSSPEYGRRRSQTHSASHSSDYDIPSQDVFTSYARKSTRRDTGDAQYLSRQPTRENISAGYDTSVYRNYDASYNEHRRGSHTRHMGRNGSKSSIRSSFELSHNNAMPSRPLGLGERVGSESILGRGRPVPGGYWHTDAAPEPAVHAGPRRRTETSAGPTSSGQMHPPLPGYETSDSSMPKRRSSIRSATSRLSRRGRPDSEAASRTNVAELFNGHGGTSGPTDALSAPSPSAGYRKTINATGANQNGSKDKPGFFRRVFGSSKNSATPTSQAEEQPQTETRPSTQTRQRATAPSHPSDLSNDRERPRTQASLKSQTSSSHIAGQMKAQPQPVPPEVPPVPAEHQSLNKKPSSFFRRRKKSINDSRPPVTILQQHPKLMNLQAGADVAPAQPSPSISSLRKVMNPYLAEGQSIQQGPDGAYYETHESQHGEDDATRSRSVFANGRVPYEGATIRQVPPGSPLVNDFGTSEWGNAASDGQRRRPESPKHKGKLRKSRPSTGRMRDDESFWVDGNGNDERQLPTLAPIQAKLNAYREIERPKTSPTHSVYLSDLEDSPAPAIPQYTGPLRKAPSENILDRSLNGSRKVLSPVTDNSPTRAEFGQTRMSPSRIKETEFVTPIIVTESRSKPQASAKSERVWVEEDNDENTHPHRVVSPLTLPFDSIATNGKDSDISPLEPPSPLEGAEVFHSATSLPIVQVDGDDIADDGDHNRNASQDTTNTDLGLKISAAESVAILTDEPQMEDRERAAKIFAGDETFIPKARAAGWLGETSFVAARTRKSYMELFDWAGLSILNAFRELCLRLILKAESQQLDRIIDAFSQRWVVCNAKHGFKAADVVHTISYSILMLNTDLHIADMDSRMTRNEFVRNTLPTIRRIADLAAADSAEQAKAPQLNLNVPGGSLPGSPTYPPDQLHLTHVSTEPASRQSLEGKRSKNRLSLLPPGLELAISGFDAASENCIVLVNKPHEGTMKSWESQIEVVLREFYNSIKQTPLPLHGSGTQGKESHDGHQNSNNLTVSSAGLRRTPSVLSKAPSETTSYRGRAAELRSATSRWPVGNKTRSRPRLYPSSTIGSSRTSLDDQSVWSPAASSTWSKYSLGKSHTQPSSWNTGAGSMSVESFGSGMHGDGYSQSIGFANALSQAIIREEHAAGLAAGEDDLEEFGKVRPLLEDESLELHGAPWAKEGLVKHKHHLETIDKKAKDRAWNECFAVVEKGYLRLFSFNQTSKSMRKGRKQSSRTGGAVGGGNWMDNAESLGCFLLRQTLASTLPPPGYSKQRPHVWALSLPTGAVHLFQVGTDDIANEFMKTANYWSARLSKEPLVGGVSNVEYGWSETVINPALTSRAGSVTPSHASASASAVQLRRPSLQSSLQGSIRGSSSDAGPSSVRAKMPGDKATISEWAPPVQSMMASQLMEVDQLKALSTYVRAVEEDLDRHNGLRQPMGFAFSPRHPNGQKALVNWEKKSAYLLREIVKFKTYVSSLSDAQSLRDKVERERQERAAVEASRKDEVMSAEERSDHFGDELAPETAEAVRRAENAEFDD